MICTKCSWLLIAMLFFASVALAAEAEAILKVNKLSCGSCINRIHSTVGDLDGTEGISKYDFPKSQIWFTYQTEKLTAEKIAETITEAGYPATVIDDGLKQK